MNELDKLHESAYYRLLKFAVDKAAQGREFTGAEAAEELKAVDEIVIQELLGTICEKRLEGINELLRIKPEAFTAFVQALHAQQAHQQSTRAQRSARNATWVAAVGVLLSFGALVLGVIGAFRPLTLKQSQLDELKSAIQRVERRVEDIQKKK